MPAGEIAAFVIPASIFVLGSCGAGVTLLVKGSAYMARSQAAQESTAKTNAKISDTLERYMRATDEKVSDLDRRVYRLEGERRPR